MKLARISMIPLFLVAAAFAANALPVASTAWKLTEGSASVQLPTAGAAGRLAVKNTGPGQAVLILRKGDKAELVRINPDSRFLFFRIEAGTTVSIRDLEDSKNESSAGTYHFVP